MKYLRSFYVFLQIGIEMSYIQLRCYGHGHVPSSILILIPYIQVLTLVMASFVYIKMNTEDYFSSHEPMYVKSCSRSEFKKRHWLWQENFKQNATRDLKKIYGSGLLFTQHEIEK